MKCYNHNVTDAIGVCVKCGKGVCSHCATLDNNKILCNSCANTYTVAPSTTSSSTKNNGGNNLFLLLVALGIDFVDALPLDLIGLGYVYELPLAGIEAFYLNSIGVPPFKNAIESGSDLIPIVDIVPWCTLATLDKKYNIKIPVLTRMFNY